MDLILLGWMCALLVGISLGLCGAGGSILTVPILVYLMGIPATDATVYSLFIVGVTAAFSAYHYHQRGHIHYAIAAAFIVPSLVSIYAVRLWLIPNLPDILYQSGDIILHRDTMIMLIFSAVMLWASRAMLRPAVITSTQAHNKKPWLAIGSQGIVLGMLVGLVGSGGGFLIIPALVTWVGLSMTQAVGTSLLIITINTLLGFVASMQSGYHLDTQILIGFTALSLVGAWLGARIACHIDDDKLKRGFAYMVIAIALWIPSHVK